MLTILHQSENMSAGASSTTTTTRSLQDTPTWALVAVCFCIVFPSLLLDHSNHLISNWLKKHPMKSLNEAMEKLKSEGGVGVKFRFEGLDGSKKIFPNINSPSMWLVVISIMLADVNGSHMYLWVAYVPLILGTKLQVIVARLALQLKDQNTVITGTPLVQPNDKFFWFSQPRFVLTLLHSTLFMNAFDVAFFIWATIEFGFDCCYHENVATAVRILSVIVQVICSYITLPLYALVTQMGSEFKSALLKEQISQVMKQWYADVKKKRKKEESSSSHQPLSSTLRNSEIGSSSRTTSFFPSYPTRHTKTGGNDYFP